MLVHGGHVRRARRQQHLDDGGARRAGAVQHDAHLFQPLAHQLQGCLLYTSAKKVKTGIAIVSSLSGTNASADETGLAQVDSTVAAVTVDEDGKIVSCKIDVAQNKVPVNADGSFDTSLTLSLIHI